MGAGFSSKRSMGLSRASGRVLLITPECLRSTSVKNRGKVPRKQSVGEAKRQESAREAKQRARKAESQGSDEVRWSDEWAHWGGLR